MRWYHRLLIGIGLIGITVLIIIFGFRIEEVIVEGTEVYSKEEIIQSVFSRDYSDNELIFWIYRKLYGIHKLPFVEDIEVIYNDRNTVTLHVYDKAVSGCIKYMGQYVYFDEEGIVLQSLSEKKEGVPMVTGIQFGKFTVGKPFSVEDDSLFSTIMNLSSLIGHYHIDVSKIHVGEGQMVLYSGNIKVFLRNKSRYDDEISVLSSILETAQRENLSGTIDMRAFEKGNTVSLQQEKKKKKNKKKEENDEDSGTEENNPAD